MELPEAEAETADAAAAGGGIAVYFAIDNGAFRRCWYVACTRRAD